MKKIITFLVLTFTFFISFGQKNLINSKIKNKEFAYLKTYNDKYSFEVNLFENKKFENRIRLLLKSRYATLIKYWNTQEPIKVEMNRMYAGACQQHNCYETNFLIVYDFEFDRFYIGVKEEYKGIKFYGEDNNIPYKLKEWGNQ